MGIFSSGGSEQIASRVAAATMLPPDHEKYRLKVARKTIARESAAIMRETAGENILLVAHSSALGSGDQAFVATESRVFTIRKGVVARSFFYAEIAETTLGAMPNGGTFVSIDSIASRQDYAPNDSRRFSQILQLEVATPRIGNAVCAVIDERIGG
jgi:hypothetical protein